MANDTKRTFLVLIVSLLAGSVAHADNVELRGFWQKGVAGDMSSTSRGNSSATFDYERKPAQKADGVPVAPVNQVAQPNPPVVASSAEAPLSRDSIISQFGSPTSPRVIKAEQNAPDEFKGLLAALNIGDKELAFQYARAFAMRSARLAELVSKATEYQMIASEAEGLRPEVVEDPEEGPISSERQELAAYYKQAKEDRLRRLQETSADKVNGIGQPVAEEAAQPSTVSNMGPGAIPVDEKGRVKLLVFINEKIPDSELNQTLSNLKEKFKADPLIELIGLTRETYAPTALKKVGATINVPIPILNGEAVGQELQIEQYPTFLFVAPTSKKTYRLDGSRSEAELEKVVRLMKGGR